MSVGKRNAAALDSKAMSETLLEIEKMLKKLGVMYNQFFSGGIKQPPTVLRSQVERLLREMAQENVRSATLRHKIQNLQATYASMQALWNAKLREREEGRRPGRSQSRADSFAERRVSTFLGGKDKPGNKEERLAKARAKDAAAKSAEATTDAQQQPAARLSEPVSDSVTGGRSADTGPASPAPSIDRLFQKIASFQMSAGQPLTFESPDQLARFIAVQKSKVEQATGQKNVQLKVVIEDGKLKFKAKAGGPG
jgi:hypothetical protein